MLGTENWFVKILCKASQSRTVRDNVWKFAFAASVEADWLCSSMYPIPGPCVSLHRQSNSRENLCPDTCNTSKPRV